MYRFLLTPRWWGINAFLVLSIPFCIFMGSWQLSRFEDRVDTHEQVTEQRDGKASGARPLAELLPVDKATSGKPATATGRYADQFLVPDRTVDGKDGFYVLTMLRTDGGDGKAAAGEASPDGKALPVVRGWLPGKADPAKAPAPPKGEVTVTGDLQSSESQGSPGVNAAGGLPQGQLGVISAASLINMVDYPVHNAWVTLTKASDGMTPVPATAPPDSGLDLKAFQNLGYTGEWFVFAAFVLFMWFRLFRRELELARDAELGITPDDPEDPGASERSRAPASTA
ncbi:SURF1 family protein [Streptomyces sp. A7024]|uniref:SURF1-like protein n=1 Tax=Streptomyces coryli TaxID=1128680 RepID=A0A6G4U566_9ACTN|nr:SURF1 family protein [Streptomyces coryli]